jgi:hypothetical protein
MTVMGKILVFVILALALVQAALHVQFHLVQNNWEKGWHQVDLQRQAAEKDVQAFQQQLGETKDADSKELLRLQNEVKIAQDKEKKARDLVDDTNRKLTELREQITGGNAVLARSQVGNERRQDEVKRMTETLNERDTKIKDLVDANNQLRDRAVAAEIEAKSLKDRNAGLVAKLQEMGKELVKVKAGGTTAVGLTAKNPPPENVEGLVTRTDPSGLLTLSIGSDAGLTKGHTLEVFRLNPAKYLGTVRILSVTPHEAVAQPVSRPLGTIQSGDRVASKILGS